MPSAGFEPAISAIERGCTTSAYNSQSPGPPSSFAKSVQNLTVCSWQRPRLRTPDRRVLSPQWKPQSNSDCRGQASASGEARHQEDRQTVSCRVACTWSRSVSYKSHYQRSPDQLPHSHRPSVSDPIEMARNKLFARTALKKKWSVVTGQLHNARTTLYCRMISFLLCTSVIMYVLTLVLLEYPKCKTFSYWVWIRKTN